MNPKILVTLNLNTRQVYCFFSKSSSIKVHSKHNG